MQQRQHPGIHERKSTSHHGRGKHEAGAAGTVKEAGMTIDEAIQHCEDVAHNNDITKQRCDDASGYTRSGREEIRTSEAKKCEQCAADHRQLAEWLKDYKRLLEQEPCEDAISRQAALEKAINVPIAKAVTDDKVICRKIIFADYIEQLPPVTPRQKTDYISIDDVMSVFDDFMCGEVDEDGTDTFLEMLKDKAESEDKEW